MHTAYSNLLKVVGLEICRISVIFSVNKKRSKDNLTTSLSR
jgi:hypothetical protein